jgi:hypothetical protein
MVWNNLDLIRVVLWTRLRVGFNAYVDTLFEIPSDLPGVNPATNDKTILYYCLMTTVDWFLAIVRYFPGRVVTSVIRVSICTRG